MKTKEFYDELRKNILKAVGLVIRRKRQRINMSQNELANILGVNKSSISRYETGKIEIPTSSLPIISDCCHFPVKDFVDAMESEKDLSSVENITDYHFVAYKKKTNKYGMVVREENTSYNGIDSEQTYIEGWLSYEGRNPYKISFKELKYYNNGINTNPLFMGSQGAYFRTMAVAYKCWREDGYNTEDCSSCRKNALFCKKFMETVDKF